MASLVREQILIWEVFSGVAVSTFTARATVTPVSLMRNSPRQFALLCLKLLLYKVREHSWWHVWTEKHWLERLKGMKSLNWNGWNHGFIFNIKLQNSKNSNFEWQICSCIDLHRPVGWTTICLNHCILDPWSTIITR